MDSTSLKVWLQDSITDHGSTTSTVRSQGLDIHHLKQHVANSCSEGHRLFKHI